MFRIGEFSKIAQVSGRLLRYYDQIGLLKPISIDAQTGYRFYSATQLPQLNQILTLKELGLTLEQIGQMLSDHVTPEDIRGMFLLRKAQIEQAIEAEQRHLRAVESRLQRLDQTARPTDVEVVIKSLPRQRFVGMREVFASLDAVRERVREIADAVSARGKELAPGPFVVVIHSDVFEPEHLDCELGQVIHGTSPSPLMLLGGQVVSARELPAVASMASSIYTGPLEGKHLAYQALGSWIEANAYRVSGPGREVFHKLPDKEHQLEAKTGAAAEAVIEVQFPVESVVQADES